MGDITDFYSSVSRTRVTPLKSFIQTFSPVTSSLVDTGCTLNVPNGQYYVMCLNVTTGGSGSASIVLRAGATTLETYSYNATGTGTSISQIYQNTTGSTLTVKVQASTLSVVTFPIISTIQIISGTNVVQIGQGSGNSIYPINAYVSNFEMQGAAPNLGTVSALNLSQQVNVSTSQTTTGFNTVVNGINLSTSVSNGPSFVAFDYDGKTVVI